VWRSATKDFSSGVTKVADVTTTSYTDTNVSYRSPYSYMIRAKYAGGTTVFSPTYALGYWGDWCLPGVDLTALVNLLNIIDSIDQLDGVISDNELDAAMRNSNIADMDGNRRTISSEEMSVFQRIQALNTDKSLLSYVGRGDYTNRTMTYDQLIEMGSISAAIKELTANRQ